MVSVPCPSNRTRALPTGHAEHCARYPRNSSPCDTPSKSHPSPNILLVCSLDSAPKRTMTVFALILAQNSYVVEVGGVQRMRFPLNHVADDLKTPTERAYSYCFGGLSHSVAPSPCPNAFAGKIHRPPGQLAGCPTIAPQSPQLENYSLARGSGHPVANRGSNRLVAFCMTIDLAIKKRAITGPLSNTQDLYRTIIGCDARIRCQRSFRLKRDCYLQQPDLHSTALTTLALTLQEQIGVYTVKVVGYRHRITSNRTIP
jgi:hypothetical protein